MGGQSPGPDAESMYPSNRGSAWRPEREPSVPVKLEHRRDDGARRPIRRALDAILSRKLEDD